MCEIREEIQYSLAGIYLSFLIFYIFIHSFIFVCFSNLWFRFFPILD